MLSPALRSYHDKVYVLTTPAAKERQRGVVEQLGEGNFEYVYGPDKNELSIEGLARSGVYDPNTFVDLIWPDMTLGHICCAIGHRNVYERFLESDGERALIFEDDVVAYDIDEEEIAAAVRNIPANAEIVYWGWWLGKFRPWSRVAQQYIDEARASLGFYHLTRVQVQNRWMRRHNRYFHTSAWNYLLHAYTITRSAAEVMIEMNTPIIMNSDHVPIKAIEQGRMRGYVAVTQLFWQRSHDAADPEVSMTRERV